MTELDDIVAKFRKGSPNIAAAFDEVQRRLALLEQQPPPTPPPPAFTCGANVPQPPPEIVGAPMVVTTWEEYLSASTKTGVLARVVQIKGKIPVPVNVPVSMTNTYVYGLDPKVDGIDGGRFLVQGCDHVRIRNVGVGNSKYDGVKIADDRPASFVDLDGLWLHDVGDQGVLSAGQPSSDIWVRNCLIERVGLTPNPGVQADGHCVYTGGPTSRWTIINNVLRPKAFGVQLSPNPRDVLVAGCTMYGGDLRGGIVLSGAVNVRAVGNIIAHSATAALENWGVTGAAVSDLVWWDCTGGLNTAGLTPVQVVNALHADPLFVDAANGDFRLQAGSPAAGMVRDLDWLPATFKSGKRRDRAAAGACEAL